MSKIFLSLQLKELNYNIYKPYRRSGLTRHQIIFSASLLIICAIILYLGFNFFIPHGTWKIFIPIRKVTSSISDNVDARLKVDNLLSEYRISVVAALNDLLRKQDFNCNVNIASFPVPGVFVNVTAPCNSKARKSIKEIVSKAVSAIKTKRAYIFSTIGLELASEASNIEQTIVSSSLSDILLNISRRQALASQTAMLEQNRLKLKNDLSKLNKTTRQSSKSSKITKKRTKSRQSKNLTKNTVKKRNKLLNELENVERQLKDLAAQNRKLELQYAKRIEYERDLLRIDAKNKVLKALFEQPHGETASASNDLAEAPFGHGAPDLVGIKINEPSHFLFIWAKFWPFVVILAATVIWFLLKKLRKITNDNKNRLKKTLEIGTIPKSALVNLEEILASTLTGSATQTIEAEAATIASSIFLKAQAKNCKNIAVLGSSKACGTSTTAAIIAASLASAGKNIILLDLNWINPAQHLLWQIPWKIGTVNIAFDAVDINTSFPNMGQRNARLTVIPAGPLPPEPQAALKIAALEKCLNFQPASNYDLLLADVGNLEETTEALPKLLENFDGVILVMKSNLNYFNILKTAPRELRKKLLGIVFTQ